MLMGVSPELLRIKFVLVVSVPVGGWVTDTGVEYMELMLDSTGGVSTPIICPNSS